ncbi:MAG: hypothetical protein CSA52_02715 [Gammaproteobacteria bacterium]|nr:MAG: hypothetical protein CSA52_02715 [Gammaproteobacteria bacterium]
MAWPCLVLEGPNRLNVVAINAIIGLVAQPATGFALFYRPPPVLLTIYEETESLKKSITMKVTTMKVTTKVMLVLFGIAAFAVAVSMSLINTGPEWEKLARQGAFPASPAKAVQPFELLDQNQQAFTEQQLRGKWSFVFIGYTFCPDVCPLTLSLFRSLYGLLEQSENMDDINFIMISADPERDTSERLKAYLSFFNPDFIGLTGDAEVTRSLARAINSGFRVPEHAPGESYFVDHSSNISLIDPSGNFVAFFQVPHSAEKMARAFSAIKD